MPGSHSSRRDNTTARISSRRAERSTPPTRIGYGVNVSPSIWVAQDWTLVAKDARYLRMPDRGCGIPQRFPLRATEGSIRRQIQGGIRHERPVVRVPRAPVIEASRDRETSRRRAHHQPQNRTSVHSSPTAKTQRPSDPIQVASSHAAPCNAGAHNPQ